MHKCVVLSVSTLSRPDTAVGFVEINFLLFLFRHGHYRGYLRQLRPYAKNLEVIIDRILGGEFVVGVVCCTSTATTALFNLVFIPVSLVVCPGNKFTISTTHILLIN